MFSKPVAFLQYLPEFYRFSTSQDAKSSYRPHTPPSTKCEQPVFQVLPTSPADPDTCLDEWPAARTMSDTTKPHTCDFNNDMSPCWNRRCELWEGINDGHSWFWQENCPYTSDSTTGKALRMEENSPADVEHGEPSMN